MFHTTAVITSNNPLHNIYLRSQISDLFTLLVALITFIEKL